MRIKIMAMRFWTGNTAVSLVTINTGWVPIICTAQKYLAPKNLTNAASYSTSSYVKPYDYGPWTDEIIHNRKRIR